MQGPTASERLISDDGGRANSRRAWWTVKIQDGLPAEKTGAGELDSHDMQKRMSRGRPSSTTRFGVAPARLHSAWTRILQLQPEGAWLRVCNSRIHNWTPAPVSKAASGMTKNIPVLRATNTVTWMKGSGSQDRSFQSQYQRKFYSSGRRGP